MQQDMLLTLSTTPPLSKTQTSSLPPYTASTLSTRFELSYLPPTQQNPIVPIYRSQPFPSPLSDGSPPEYRHSLQSTDTKPAYILHFDASTKDTVLATPDGQKLASISFLKPRRQTITTFGTSDADAEAQTLAGSSITIADEEAEETDQVLLHSETLSNDDDDDGEDDGVQEEVGSILLDAAVPAKETITLSSHKYFHPKGTSFTTPSGNIYRWQKSISAASPPPAVRGIPTNAQPHYTFILTRSSPKGRRGETSGHKRIVGRMDVSENNSSKAILELKGGQEEELSESMFLGSAIAMLKKVDLKATRQRAQKALPQNVMQLTF